MEQGATFRVTVPKYGKGPNYRILAPQRSRFTHYYFYIRDEVLGPIVMRVGSFFPSQTSYYLNGHSFIERELKRAQIEFRKTDNVFLAVDDVAALQAAADKLRAGIIRQRLDYWTLILGPKFSAKQRKQFQLSRFYAIAQIELAAVATSLLALRGPRVESAANPAHPVADRRLRRSVGCGPGMTTPQCSPRRAPCWAGLRSCADRSESTRWVF
jgi:hypothetical protein